MSSGLTIGVDASVVASSSGGTRVYALQLLQTLVGLHSRWNFVLYLRKSGEEDELGNLALAPNVQTRVVRGRPNAWRVQVVLPSYLYRDRVDVYHSLGFFLPLRWTGPKVVTVHDLNMYVNPRSWLRGQTFFSWMDLALQTLLSIRAADRVITDSESWRREISRYARVNAEKLRVIPLAADPYFSGIPSVDEISQAKTLATGSPYVLFVGILSPSKNLVFLLRAYAASRLPTSGVRLLLAGSDRDGYGRTLRNIARSLGVANLVDMPGFVSRPMLRALYHSALGIVLPSHGEGFGLPLVEGMACGTPILAANRQAIPEVLGNAGLLFDPEDVAELGGLLSRLAEDGQFRSELARRAQDGRGRFSWEKTAEATADVYEEVLAIRRR